MLQSRSRPLCGSRCDHQQSHRAVANLSGASLEVYRHALQNRTKFFPLASAVHKLRDYTLKVCSSQVANPGFACQPQKRDLIGDFLLSCYNTHNQRYLCRGSAFIDYYCSRISLESRGRRYDHYVDLNNSNPSPPFLRVGQRRQPTFRMR